MEQDKLTQQVEALLFYKGEPMRISVLAKTLNRPEEAVRGALQQLQANLTNHGIALVMEGEYAGLATSPESTQLIEAVRKEELEGPLGKAGLETLAIVIYHGPLSKADIEYIRGVNSSSILRSLTMRGLIEKIDNPNDRRSVLYRPTPELPAHLGISSTAEAPEFETVKNAIKKILDDRDQEEKKREEEVGAGEGDEEWGERPVTES